MKRFLKSLRRQPKNISEVDFEENRAQRGRTSEPPEACPLRHVEEVNAEDEAGRRLSSKSARKIFGVASVGFFLLTIPSLTLAKTVLDKTVVIVNDEVILESDVGSFLKKVRSKSYQELLGIDPTALKNRDSVIGLLVDEKIIDQQVKKLDLSASDQEIDGQIRSILKRNNISMDQLTERIQQLGTSMNDYREGLKRQIERRNLVEREIKPNQEVTDEQLRHFYARSGGEMGNELEYKIAHILIDAKKPGAEARAKKIYEDVSKDPDNFDKYARDYSDDLSTSSSGGNLGYLPLSQMAKEFRDPIKNTAAGKITKPVKTSAGYHIIRVLETRTSDFSTLSKEKKEALRAQLLGSELEKRMAMWLERKKMESHIKKF